MKLEHPLQRGWVKWGMIFGLWTLIGLGDAAQTYLQSLYTQRPIAVWRALVIGVCDWYTFALLTPVLFFLARRFRFRRPHRHRDLLVHILASAVCSLIVLAVAVPMVDLVCDRLREPLPLQELFHRYFFVKFQLYMLIYWVVIGLYYALDYYNKYQERELKASQLETQLAQAQLQVLKMQLQPHFLFNTLNAISALIHKDVETADRMIARLGELLRSTLETTGTQEVPLWQELDFIKPYLEIEQARLGSRLRVHIDVDPEAMDCLVPNLILQPLVENAIRHGVSNRVEPGLIEIEAYRDQDLLELIIRDNGQGLSSNYKEGVGVGNTRTRLQQLYGPAHRFVLENHARGGAQVTVAVPFREAPRDDSTLPAAPAIQQTAIRSEQTAVRG